jgi:hypothetical protein
MSGIIRTLHCPEKLLLAKIWEFKGCGQIIWAIFFRKKCAQRQKYRPNGEVSPILVTLAQFFKQKLT